MNKQVRKALGVISQKVFPQMGSCGSCGMTWNVCEAHSTQYTERSGCFPLCELCWKEFTPNERLPFYKKLYNEWIRQGSNPDEEKWESIEKAVLEGK